jgi:hypothetical protein
MPIAPRSSVLYATLAWLLLAPACGRGTIESGCVSTPVFFEHEVWTPLMSRTCLACHTETGPARNTRFVLRRGSTADDLEANLAAVSAIADLKADGTSLLLAKPTAKVRHGGGRVVTEGSPAYQSLVSLVLRLAEGETCGPPGTPQNPRCELVTPKRVWRLSHAEYDNTVFDLLGDDSQPSLPFVADEEVHGFANNATALRVSPVLAEQLLLSAERIAARALGRLSTLLPCDPAEVGEAACARRFVETFGLGAYRRPLAPEETEALLAVFALGREGADFRGGVEWVLVAMLASPSFLYRAELGEPLSVASGPIALTSYELASQLSYLLTAGPPDKTLLDLAAQGSLAQSDVREAQARRLLASPRAKVQMRRFVFDWLGLTSPEELEKDTDVYPAYTPELRTAMRAETEAFLDDVLFAGDGTLGTLLSAPYTFANAPLAELYGVPYSGNGELARVSLDPSQRSGLLTHASVLGTYAHPNESSPVFRGKFVRTRLLCQDLPPPPNDLLIELPKPSPELTTRERFALHSSSDACAGCHSLMDPIGFGFENYDGIGRFRSLEQGKPIDARGELSGTQDADGAFVGAPALAQRLSQSREVAGCFARSWLRFARGRSETADDECALAGRSTKFYDKRTRVLDLMIDFIRSDDFVLRRPVGASP